MLKPLRYPVEIADAGIRVLERPWVHLIDHRPLPPSVVFHCHSSVPRREPSPGPLRQQHLSAQSMTRGGPAGIVDGRVPARDSD